MPSGVDLGGGEAPTLTVLFLLCAKGSRCELPVPAAMLVHHGPYPSGTISPDKLFPLQVALTVVFYHSNRKVANLVTNTNLTAARHLGTC